MAVLHRNLDVREVDVFEISDLLEGRLHQRLRGGAAVLIEKILIERSAIYADPDRDTAILGGSGNGLDVGLIADVPRI